MSRKETKTVFLNTVLVLWVCSEQDLTKPNVWHFVNLSCSFMHVDTALTLQFDETKDEENKISLHSLMLAIIVLFMMMIDHSVCVVKVGP